MMYKGCSKSWQHKNNEYPVDIRFIFQLRLRLSPLRSHKWRHNFIDTTSDTCHCKQGVENTDHFLLYCSSYTTQRASLIVSTIEIILTNGLNDYSHQSDFYLYGHSSLRVSDNKKILLATITFIKDSQRFMK